MRKLILLIVAALLVVPAVTQAKTLEDLLVEKGVITVDEARGSSHGGGANVYWNDGTRLDFPDSGFTVNIGTVLQTRYTFTDADSDAKQDNTSSFDVNIARIMISGTALNEEFSYFLETSFDDGGSPELLDANFTWRPCEGGHLRMGQFKTGISRQFNTGDHVLQFPDRSVISDNYSLDRNQGLEAGYSELWDGRVVVGGQIFNGNSAGEGRNLPGNDTKHLGVATVRVDIMGEMDAHVEGDVDWTEDAALNWGAAYAYGENEILADTIDAQNFSTDINFKYEGWSAHGEFFWDDRDADIGPLDTDTTGAYVQVGYFINPKKLEIAARYGFIDCDEGKGQGDACQSLGVKQSDGDSSGDGGTTSTTIDDVNEINVSINYYWWQHHLKAQFGWSFLNQDTLNPGSEDINTNKWLFQLAGWF